VLRAVHHLAAPETIQKSAGAILALASDMDTTMTKPTCPHQRTQLIAKDNDAQYVECLDCGEILESAEMEKIEKKEGAGFDESLSDA
jgi:Zn ribbon nucleic-acid-binding protein